MGILYFLIIIISLIILGFLVYVWDDLFGGEDYATSKSTIKKISEIILAHGAENYLLYDLGSSRGGFLLGLLDTCPNLQTVGIDNSSVRTFIARLRGLLHKNKPKNFKADLFSIDISKVDMVYAYLPRPMLPALEEKLRKELKSGALAITSRVFFPTWIPIATFAKNSSKEEDIFLYKKI
ncbi:MAG: class I SAM-dependent methyltransferase [Patescibacteria group bacterium]